MFNPPPGVVRDVTGISPDAKRAIKDFMQGAVYCWTKNKKDEAFAARDLVGGENSDWGGTPLSALYQKHVGQGRDEKAAFEAAGQDLGWLLLAVCSEDKRHFERVQLPRVAGYRLVGGTL